MSSIAFKIGPLSIHWYGIIIALAFGLGIALASYHAAQRKIDMDKFSNLVIVTIPAAIIGARLYYVLFQWDYYAANPQEIVAVWHGGLAVHGGVIGGVLAGLLYVNRAKTLQLWICADIVAPSLILGQAIGRWGNFINGEAHGGPTDLPWGILVDGVKVHPTFLYESLWDFGLFIFLIIYRKKKKFDGQIFLLYSIIYSAGRFWIEGLRTDSLMFMGIRVAQLVSVLIIIFGLLFYYKMRRKDKNIENY